MKHLQLLFLLCVLCSAIELLAAEPADGDSADSILAGHSKHGEVFNDGPRQRAYLMSGTGKITFEVNSDVPLVRKFVEQGIGQLHGFWYFEAERSFRQAAMLDPDCAIAYWGMAAANANNDDRAKDFIQKAYTLIDHASPREEMYILSLHEFLTSDGKRKEREARYAEAIEEIIEEYPDDIEAKALLGYVLYRYRDSAGRKHSEVDVVLDQIIAKEKKHPAHHYRIHLWDQKSPQRALDSAAQCGNAAEGIAHMWHMCGHIFSRVKRYGDAAWFQEASARVDHRHMMHDRVLPDQIHNFAHNNEWLIRNLMHVGRVSDALDLAKNMIELPRHPKYNVLDKRNSASYGRDRLINVLERFELWEEAIDLAQGPYLEPTDDTDEQLKRLKLLGTAYARTGRIAEAHAIVDDLEGRLDELRATPPTKESVAEELEAEEESTADDASDGETEEPEKKEESAEEKLKKKLKQKQEDHKDKLERIERDIARIGGFIAVDRDDLEEALRLLEKAEVGSLSLAKLRVRTGEHEEAVEEAKEYASDRKKQVQPLAGLVEVSWEAGNVEEASDAFVRLRANSNWLEIDSPVFKRLAPIAHELGYPADWRVTMPNPDDLGKQPPLEDLGPFRWSPAPAPNWLLPDSAGVLHSMREYRGKPVIMIFYLGYGCLHCAEQLQVVAPRVDEFQKAGISLIAVSTDDIEGLEKSQENYDGERIPFPLVADPSNRVFKAFRAYDDFEDLPLHGTYLVDGRGRIRWQDISYDPFMDVDFLLEESKRLLEQDEMKLHPSPSTLTGNR